MNGIKDIPGALATVEQDIEYIDNVEVDEDKSADQRFKPPIKKPTIKKDNLVKPPVIAGGSGKVPDTRPKRPAVRHAAGQPLKPPSRSSMPVVPAPPSRLDRLLSIVNTATGVLGLIHPLNSVFNPDGTTTWPDGSVVDAQGQSVRHVDGSVQNIDGTTVHADGSTTHPDGSIEYKDGTWKLADGTVKYPDGRWKHSDGTVTDAEGNVLGMVKPS